MDTRCDPPGGARRVGQRSIAGGDSWGSLAAGKRVAASGRRPETRAGGVRQTARRNQRCEAPTRREVGYFRRKEIGDGNDKVGTQGNNHLAAAQPDLHVWRGIHGGRSDRTFSLLPVHLRQQPATAFLYADLHPVERRGSNRSEPQRQLPDAHGGRSRNSTASGDERRRDRRQDAGTGRQTHPACALAIRLAARLCSPLSRDRSRAISTRP